MEKSSKNYKHTWGITVEYFSLYLKFIGIKFRSVAEYRGAFIVNFVAKTALWVSDLVLIWLLIFQFKAIGNWTQYEVIFLYSLNLACFSIAGFFLNAPFMKLPQRIQSGEFDDVLTKPLNPFLYLISRDFSTGYISNVTVAFTAMVISCLKLGISFDLIGFFFLLTVLFGGALIQAAMFLIANVPAFWVIQNKSLQDLLLSDLRSFVRYPISIYHKSIQILLTFILPYAFMSYYPSHYFLDKSFMEGSSSPLLYLTPAVGLIMFALSYQFWKVGLRHYNSTGS